MNLKSIWGQGKLTVEPSFLLDKKKEVQSRESFLSGGS